MSKQAASNYDDEQKVWSGGQVEQIFPPELSIGEIIFREMEKNKELIAQISATEGTVLTRGELLLNAMRVASYMRNRGLGQEDIVGLIARQTTHMAAVAYACFFNGTPVHCLHKAFDLITIEKLYGLTRPKLIFCDGDEYGRVRAATANLDCQIITMRNHLPGVLQIQDILATPVAENFQPVRLKGGNDQTLAILCSSGTTGIPKAVTISNTHHMIPSKIPITTSTVQYTTSTLDWNSGLNMILGTGVYSTTNIIADNDFDPDFLCDLIEKYKVELIFVAPHHVAMLAKCKKFESVDLSTVKFFFCSGSRCSKDAAYRVRKQLGRNVFYFAYGLTEMNASGSCINYNFDANPRTVGRPMAGTRIKIIDEDGTSLGPNDLGEVCLHNGQHWSGYYGNPEETEKLRDSQNWIHSADLGYMDDDGYLYIIGRVKDKLKYQNQIYYPSEIEDIIAEMPDVIDSCVFGVYKAENGDEAAAEVVRRPGSNLLAQDVVDYVKTRISAKYKQLNGGALIVDNIVISANAKINRNATKAHFLKITNTKEDI